MLSLHRCSRLGHPKILCMGDVCVCWERRALGGLGESHYGGRGEKCQEKREENQHISGTALEQLPKKPTFGNNRDGEGRMSWLASRELITLPQVDDLPTVCFIFIRAVAFDGGS